MSIRPSTKRSRAVLVLISAGTATAMVLGTLTSAPKSHADDNTRPGVDDTQQLIDDPTDYQNNPRVPTPEEQQAADQVVGGIISTVPSSISSP
jgi:hypothetical protein